MNQRPIVFSKTRCRNEFILNHSIRRLATLFPASILLLLLFCPLAFAGKKKNVTLPQKLFTAKDLLRLSDEDSSESSDDEIGVADTVASGYLESPGEISVAKEPDVVTRVRSLTGSSTGSEILQLSSESLRRPSSPISGSSPLVQGPPKPCEEDEVPVSRFISEDSSDETFSSDLQEAVHSISNQISCLPKHLHSSFEETRLVVSSEEIPNSDLLILLLFLSDLLQDDFAPSFHHFPFQTDDRVGIVETFPGPKARVRFYDSSESLFHDERIKKAELRRNSNSIVNWTATAENPFQNNSSKATQPPPLALPKCRPHGIGHAKYVYKEFLFEDNKIRRIAVYDPISVTRNPQAEALYAREISVYRNERIQTLKALPENNRFLFFPEIEFLRWKGQELKEALYGDFFKSTLRLTDFSTLSQDQILDHMIAVFSGLSLLHKNQILHGDVKSDNVLVHGSETKLADFGSAFFLKIGEVKEFYCGAFLIAAPEALLPQEITTEDNIQEILRQDIFSASLMFFQLLYPNETPALLEFQDKFSHLLTKEKGRCANAFSEKTLRYSQEQIQFWKGFLLQANSGQKPFLKELLLEGMSLYPKERPSAETMTRQLQDYKSKNSGSF